MSYIDDFWAWFDRRRNGISIREIERQSRYPRGRIGNRYGHKPSEATCVAIASGLNIPLEEVFRLAKILPPLPDMESDINLKEIYEIARKLTPQDRQNLRNFAQHLRQQQPRATDS